MLTKYLGDPRESLVDFEAPGVWEADNRVEERWQWGAQVLDLCGLSPEEYKNSTAVTVKTIQNCGECGGGGKISKNNGSANIENDGLFSVSFDLPVASPLYVFVTFTDDNGDEYSFKVKVDEGSDNATFDVSTLTTAFPYSIDEVNVGFKEDGSDAGKTAEDKSYEYSVTYGGGGGDEDGTVYAFSILCTKTDTLTGDDYQAIIDAQGQGFDYVASYDEANFADQDSAEVGFVALGSVVEQYMPEDVEQQYFNEHSYDFVFITKKAIAEIKEDFTTDTDNWEKGDITVSGKKFVKWMRRDLSGAQCPYSIEPDPCDDYELTYILNIKK